MSSPFDGFDLEPQQAPHPWWRSRAMQWSVSAAFAALILFSSLYASRHASRGTMRFTDPDAIELALMPFDVAAADSSLLGAQRELSRRLETDFAEQAGDRASSVGAERTGRLNGAARSLDTLAISLGATHVLFGSLRRDSGRVRIFARLVRVNDGVPLFAVRQYAPPGAVVPPAVADSIMRGVLRVLRLHR